MVNLRSPSNQPLRLPDRRSPNNLKVTMNINRACFTTPPAPRNRSRGHALSRWLSLSAVLALSLFAGRAALAQSYPSKPIRIIVPYAAGGGTDILSRVVGERLQVAFGQSVLVENRAGANGIIGSDVVAKAAPDGYTLMVVVGTHVMNPYLYKTVPFDAIKDFTAITLLATSPTVLVSSPQQPYANVRELIAFAKANPGKLSYGSSEANTQLAGFLFNQRAGVDIANVPYKGGGPMMTDIVGGHLATGFTSVVTALSFVKAGKLRVLGVGSPKRTGSLPDTPTIAEAGVTGYDVTSWYGMFAPAGLPTTLRDRLQSEIARILADPAVSERVVALGADPSGMKSDEFSQFVTSYAARTALLIKEAGIKPSE
jgi:tripartite-type tricarboxylate transporter receptor subunit TctC